MRLHARLTSFVVLITASVIAGCAGTQTAPTSRAAGPVLAASPSPTTSAAPTTAPSVVAALPSAGMAGGTSMPPASMGTPVAVFICLDASGSYPPALLARARGTIGDLLLQRVQPGHAGTKIWVRWITGASRSEEAYLTNFEVSPVPAPPTRRADRPKPPKPDLESVEIKFNRNEREKLLGQWDRDVRAWEAEITASEAAYNEALAAQRRALTSAQALMKAGVDQIRTTPPPPAAGSDIWGCIVKGATVLAAERGTRILISSTDLQPFGEQDSGSLSLTGVRVKAAFFFCSRAAACDAERRRWEPIFLAAGAVSVEFFDPDADVRTLLKD